MKKEDGLIIGAGVVIGAIAVALVVLGNPPNMGFCIACFVRDIAGALGLHRAALVQYLRPEIIGILFGALLSAFAFKEFQPKGGSSPVSRFLLGALMMVGALIFLGCPLRMILRMAGGDLNAWIGLVGFAAGILGGVFLLKAGFNLGKSQKINKLDGWVLPLVFLALFALALLTPVFNAEAGGPIFASKEGPGSMHAALIFSILAGLVIGFLGQRTRLCFAGAIRDIFLIRNAHLFLGIAAIFAAVLIGDLALGKFTLGFVNQPIAHTDGLWNFLGMSLVGLAAVLLGGCPFRQLILSSEGNADSVAAVLGMFVGAAFAHNFMLASTPQGPTDYGKIAVIAGLVIAAGIGWLNLEKQTTKT